PYNDEEQQDDADSQSLYSLLENEIVPLYYERNENGIPVGWVRMMKNSIISLTPKFSTHRMLEDYTVKFYNPCIERRKKISNSNYEIARKLSSFKQHISRAWSDVRIMADSEGYSLRDKNAKSGETINLNVVVRLGDLSPEEVLVEAYYGPIVNNRIQHGKAVEMNIKNQSDSSTYHYSVDLNITDGGEYGYSFRIVPRNENLFNKYDMPFVKWVND
ncbi:MAG TPA: alpha-glucan phosphorylase, partial [Thermoclostridium sp.]|nr:alpha-glucan phosphorylase [Thermoclostridium sp.]